MNGHDFDRAMAEGVDSGRYAFVLNDGGESVPVKGPRFDDPASRTKDTVLQPYQVWLDNVIEQNEKQR